MKKTFLIYPVIISVVVLFLTTDCKKEEPTAIPLLTTTPITNVTATTATSGGNITSDGRATITVSGVCWSTTANPTTSDSKTTDGTHTVTGQFVSSIGGLTPGTTYYVRAYATNSVGTAYGIDVTFTTTSSVTVADVDGNVYQTVTIGTQVWMGENLKTTKYRNGDLIGTTTPATLDISAEATPKYQWAYDGNENYVATYGRLYTWYAVTDTRNVCPTGWHLPNDAEWATLTTSLGGEDVAGGKLKEAGTTHWSAPNEGATNSSGFTALPSGYRNDLGAFVSVGYDGSWWSSTEYTTTYAYYLFMFYLWSDVYSYSDGYQQDGFSVRCLRD
jgi:uncharacterized protein (TIGR02145 family)